MSVLVEKKFVSQKTDSFAPIKNFSDVLIAKSTRESIILSNGLIVTN